MALLDASPVEIVLGWEPALGGGSSAKRSWQLISSQPDVVAQLLAPTVNQLFRVTLALAATAALTDDVLASRLLVAVKEIDAAIHQLRCSLLILTGDDLARDFEEGELCVGTAQRAIEASR